MELLDIIKAAPEWVALFIAVGWIVHLRNQVTHLQSRIERISDRQEILSRSLIGRLTKTDLNEG